MNPIYQMAHGLKLDLDKIVYITPVTVNEYNDHIISIRFQMMMNDTDLVFKSSGNTPGEVEFLKNATTLEIIKFNIFTEHRDLTNAWEAWKLSKKKNQVPPTEGRNKHVQQ